MNARADEFAERLGKAFRAACSDLKPGGRLPEGMDDAKATRAVLAYIAFRLHDLNESLLEALEDVNGPEWGQQMRDELGGNLPPSQLSPEQAAAWMREQDLTMLRDVMARTLETIAAESDQQGDPAHLKFSNAILHAIANDLDSGNKPTIDRLVAAYDAARQEKGGTDAG